MLMNACFLWFLCQLSCVLNFNYFMPSSCTITHKSKAPSLFINVMHFIKNQGNFDNFSREIEWKMPTYDSSNKHFWASNNSPQLDSCLSSSKVCLFEEQEDLLLRKRFFSKLDKRLKHKRNSHIQVHNGLNKIIPRNLNLNSNAKYLSIYNNTILNESSYLSSSNKEWRFCAFATAGLISLTNK